MRVGYNKVFGGLLLGLGILCLVLGFLAHLNMSMLVGAVNGLIGFLYLVKPYFVLTPRAIELQEPLRHDHAPLRLRGPRQSPRFSTTAAPSSRSRRAARRSASSQPLDRRRQRLAPLPRAFVQARAFE
ncbi:MAG: hypothetical protein U1F43_38900 [Myxococcota bacterium]